MPVGQFDSLTIWTTNSFNYSPKLKQVIYHWGDSIDVRYASGVLSSKFNFNAVLAAEYLKNNPTFETAYVAKYEGVKTTVGNIAAYDDAGNATALSIGPSGQVRGCSCIGDELQSIVEHAGHQLLKAR